MRRFRTWFVNFFGNRFGKCARCMRIALRCAFAAWAALWALSWLPIATAVHDATLLLATGLTALTLTHIGFFAGRQVAAGRNFARSWRERQGMHNAPPLVAGQPLEDTLNRRQAVSLFARGALVAGLASVGYPRRAVAACGDCGAGWHDCITNFCGTTGQVCCPQGYPYLNHCDCTCYDGTDFDCSSYSNCNYCG